jgi:hypothetical protein
MTVESGGTSPALLLGALVGLVVLAALIFVVALGYLRGRESDQNGRSKDLGRRRGGRRPAGPGEAGGAGSIEWPVPDPATSTRRDEVMRVLRDPDSGRVLVEVEGRRYEHIREIEEAQAGRRVLWAIADLIRFTGGMATNARAVRSASEGMAWEERASGAAWPAQASALSDAGMGEASSANLGQSVREFFRRGLNPPPTGDSAPEPGWFIDQIEAILQARVQALDAPLPYEVHVSSGPEQRLQIRVGQEVYGSVDEIPDPQAQALIRAAVEEWERR